MQQKKDISLLMELALVERIVNADIKIGNANMRLQLYGLYKYIQLFANNGEIVTTQFLVKKLNINKASLLRMTSKLEQLGILNKTEIHASHGKGRLFAFCVSVDEQLAHNLLDEAFS